MKSGSSLEVTAFRFKAQSSNRLRAGTLPQSSSALAKLADGADDVGHPPSPCHAPWPPVGRERRTSMAHAKGRSPAKVRPQPTSRRAGLSSELAQHSAAVAPQLQSKASTTGTPAHASCHQRPQRGNPTPVDQGPSSLVGENRKPRRPYGGGQGNVPSPYCRDWDPARPAPGLIEGNQVQDTHNSAQNVMTQD